MNFIQNGVDNERRQAKLIEVGANNGASYLSLPDYSVSKWGVKESVQTVLLSDILQAIEIVSNPKQIIIKIDIELYECRAILGAAEIFKKAQKFTITAIIMEWKFLGKDGAFRKECPKEQLRSMTCLLLRAGYVPLNIKDLSPLNYSNFGAEWGANILWILNRTDSIIKMPNRK